MEVSDDFMRIDGEEIPFRLLRSDRRSLALEIRTNAGQAPEVLIRAPRWMKMKDILTFINSREKWITENYRKVLADREQAAPVPVPDYMTEAWLRTEGLDRFRETIEGWARRMGIAYGRVTIRDQKTRWGSCSSKGNLNFSWRLLMMPQEIMDYVVVHELAHRREMNHSPRFWAIVGTYIPDYQARRDWLKKNGGRYSG